MPDETGAVELDGSNSNWIDQVAAAVAARLTKAVVPGMGLLPPGSRTTDLVPLARAAGESQQRSIEPFDSLPREAQTSIFAPGSPLLPSSIDPRLVGSSRPDPRISQFPVSWNLMTSGDRAVPWETLRRVADLDIVRRCIEVRKSQLLSLEWDIMMTPAALEEVMAEEGDIRPGQASKIARRRYAADIARLSSFWDEPDRMNDLDFPSWLLTLLEEHFVLDAIAIFPRQTLGGELHSFEILDGSTIKPLLDHRGGVPRPPLPAFQQMLFGFPRGEFVASTVDVDQEYSRDRLIYGRRVPRTFSPYGLSNVEQALGVANSYLKRMGWLVSEFDDGTLPDTFIQTDMEVANPNDLALWEAILNDALRGDTTARHALKFLPRGFTPEQMTNASEKFNPDLDEFFIKLCCMCFDVMPTEIGFPPKSGIGGKGHQEGEENSSYRKGIRPSVVWLQRLLTKISRTYLGMPPQLQFGFIGYQQEDQKELEEMADLRTRSGRSTINEERSARGQPLYDFEEADSPYVVTGSGIVFLNGSLARQAASDVDQTVDTTAEVDTAVDAPPASATDPVTEIGKFAGYVRRRAGSGKWRPFTFKAVQPELAGLLNGWGELAALGDETAFSEMAKAVAGLQEVAA